MIVKELLTRLGFDIDEAKLEAYEHATNTAVKATLALTVVATAAAGAIYELLNSALEHSIETRRMAAVTGLTVNQVEQLEFVARRSGTEVNALTRSIFMLTRAQGEAVLKGGEHAVAFARLGIGMQELRTLKPEQIFERTLAALQKIPDRAKQAAIGQELFNRGFLELQPLLQRGPEFIRDTAKAFEEYGLGLSEVQQENLSAYWLATSTLKATVSSMRDQIAADFAPIVTRAVNRMLEWIKVNKEFVKSSMLTFFKTLYTVANAAFNVLDVGLSVVGSVVSALGGLQNVVTAVAGAFALWFAVNTLMGIPGLLAMLYGAIGKLVVAMWTFDFGALLIPAAIALVVLALQDFYGWVTGMDSVLGRAFGPFDKFKKMFLDFLSGDVLGKIYDIGYSLGARLLDGMEAALKDRAKSGGVGGFLSWMLSGGFQTSLEDRAKEGGVGGFASWLLASKPGASTLAPVGAGGSNTATTTIHAPITVNAAPGTTHQQARQIADAVGDHFKTIQQNFPRLERGP